MATLPDSIPRSDDDQTTQPFSCQGSDGPIRPGDENYTPHLLPDDPSDLSDNASGAPHTIDLEKQTVVVWEDPDTHQERAESLLLSLYVCDGRALVKLYDKLFLKLQQPKAKSKSKARTANNSRTLFLFFYPEDIDSVEFETSKDCDIPLVREKLGSRPVSLRFGMKHSPGLVHPRDTPLEVKKNSEAKLHSMVALAKIKHLTLYLQSSDIASRTRAQLASLPRIFSASTSAVHLITDTRRANLDSLYQGKGGQLTRFNGSLETCDTSSKEKESSLQPRPYHASSRRGSEKHDTPHHIMSFDKSNLSTDSEVSPSVEVDSPPSYAEINPQSPTLQQGTESGKRNRESSSISNGSPRRPSKKPILEPSAEVPEITAEDGIPAGFTGIFRYLIDVVHGQRDEIAELRNRVLSQQQQITDLEERVDRTDVEVSDLDVARIEQGEHLTALADNVASFQEHCEELSHQMQEQYEELSTQKALDLEEVRHETTAEIIGRLKNALESP